MGHRRQRLQQIAGIAGHEHLAFGIAEAAIVFHQLGPAAVSKSPA